jgi:hypothetical protein
MIDDFATGHSGAFVVPVRLVELTNRRQRNLLAGQITGQFDEMMNVPCAETLR